MAIYGREVIEKVYSDIFHTEDSLVRIQFVNGTHALSTALMGNLTNKDVLVSITGDPYDSLSETIGTSPNPLSLISKGIKYKKIELLNNDFDICNIEKCIKENKVKMIFIGRSKGYTKRESLTIKKIGTIIKKIKDIDNKIIIMVDNCYGEFVEEKEPTDVGADIIAGSLIKNIGGGICETGGYIAR